MIKVLSSSLLEVKFPTIIILLILLFISSISYSRKLDELTEIMPTPMMTETIDNNYAILSSQPNDSIYYYNIPSEPVNFTANAGEKMAVLFHPVAECSLFALKFYNTGCDSNVNVILGVYKSPITLEDLRANYDPVTSGSGTPLPDSLGNLLLANPLWGPFEVTLKASSTGYVKNIIDLSEHGTGYIDIGYNDFIVCYELKLSGCPNVLATSLPWSIYDYLASSLKYYNTVEPNGWRYRNYNWWFKALVYYYGCPPPVIENVTVIDDNYLVGTPYTISAKVSNKEFHECLAGVDTVFVICVVNGITDTIETTHIGDIYSAELPAGNVGDYYKYYFIAYNLVGDFAKSKPIDFTIRKARHSILFINDGADTLFNHLYTDILNYYGFGYDYWNIKSYGQPGNDVINRTNYNSIIWYTGVNSGSLSSVDTLVASYLNSGGNLFFSSSEFLGDYYVFADCSFNFDGSFIAFPGEFPFDYLKIASGKSDANIKCPDGYGQDTLYFGIAGDLLTGKYTAGFEADPHTLGYIKRRNDEIVARSVSGARNAFEVYSISDSANVPAGIVYDGNYKLVFLPWVFEATPDSIRYPLLRDIILWFDPTINVSDNNFGNREIIKDLRLEQNYPNPFNPITNIRYQVLGEREERSGDKSPVLRPSSLVSLKIYNITGQLVKTLVHNEQSPGYYSVQWDGKDDNGNNIASGIYIYRLQVGNKAIIKRMMIIR